MGGARGGAPAGRAVHMTFRAPFPLDGIRNEEEIAPPPFANEREGCGRAAGYYCGASIARKRSTSPKTMDAHAATFKLCVSPTCHTLHIIDRYSSQTWEAFEKAQGRGDAPARAISLEQRAHFSIRGWRSI